MPISTPDIFESSTTLSLWFKIKSGEALNLADVPEIIPVRWSWFRDTWNFLRTQFVEQSVLSSDPDHFRQVLDSFTDFIEKERTTSTEKNPFLGREVLLRFYPIFDQIPIEHINLTPEEQRIVDDKQRFIAQLSKNDFLKIKREIINYRDHIADINGAGDKDYNRIFKRGSLSAPATNSSTFLNLMAELQRQISSVDFILANLFTVNSTVDPFALAKANANNPEIDIGQYNSGFLVKLHYGEDLPALARRYLGNSDKWIDIAIANGLKEPYIDEVGKQLFLLSNGNGNQLNIAALDTEGKPNITKFFINQLITVQSTLHPFPSQRKILAIRDIPISGEIVLTVDGDSDLNLYKKNDSANIRVFKPNTINSSQFILIPSASVTPNNGVDEVPWFLSSKLADEKQTKIDLAISENGSLLFTANGDVPLSYGLANAMQAIRLKLSTELGTNRYHPALGLVDTVGKKNLSVAEIQQTLIQSITSQIQADARFDRVETIDVTQIETGPVGYVVNLTVRLAGGNTLIPISFSIVTPT